MMSTVFEIFDLIDLILNENNSQYWSQIFDFNIWNKILEIKYLKLNIWSKIFEICLINKNFRLNLKDFSPINQSILC